MRDFRKSLGNCKLDNYEPFTGKREREANEFLKYLFSIFPDDKENTIVKTYYINDLDTEINTVSDIENLNSTTCESITNQTGDVYYYIKSHDIGTVSYTSVKLSSFLHKKEEHIWQEGDVEWVRCNNNYKRNIKFYEFKEDRYIIFDLIRALPGKFLGQKITPDEEIELSNGKKFKFVSSVHRTSGLGGAHFTSFILLNDIWYYYNDMSMPSQLEKVGNYDQLLTYEDEAVKQSVMYFYEPIFS